MAPLLQQAPGLLDEVVEAGIIAVHDLTSEPHGGLDILNREETCVLPVGGLRAVFGHTTSLPDSRLPRGMARFDDSDGASPQTVPAPHVTANARLTASVGLDLYRARMRFPPTARAWIIGWVASLIGRRGRRCRVLHVTGDGSREKAAGVPGRLTAGWRAATRCRRFSGS